MRRFPLALPVLLAAAVASNAQTVRGTINGTVTNGTVTDPTGAVVANEKVKATKSATSIDHNTVTTSSSQVLPNEAQISEEIRQFLVEYWRGFERDDVKGMVSSHTDDYSAYFSIPSKGRNLETYDAAGITLGLEEAFAHFRGHHPRMEVVDVIVLQRSSDSAVASYRQHFYLDGVLKGDAIAISELIRDRGRWKIYRHFEVKRH